MPRSLLTLSLMIGSFSLLLMGCPPKYPKCDKDENCKKGEFCVNGMCQQCRNDKDCGEGKTCKEGRCEDIPGYCKTSEDCSNGQVCKENRCAPCANDGECGPDGRCRNGRCLKPGECATDDDCPENHECQNGTCVAPPKPADAGPCSPEPVYFDFNEFVLTSKATSKLQAAAKCIKSVANRKMRIEGHCDSRGTEEYNLSLGDRRARSVIKYLRRLGVSKKRLRPVSKGKLEATGSEESSWAMDRKVKFIWE